MSQGGDRAPVPCHTALMSSRSQYPLLMSPFELRGRMLRNRIVSTPHATGWSHDGLIAQTEIDYHVRKAAGGAGLVMTFGSASCRSDHPGLVRVHRPVGRTQRAGAARTGRRDPRPRGALHLADDPHGTPRQLPHLRRTAAGALGPAGGVTPRGAGAARGRRATGDRASGSPRPRGDWSSAAGTAPR